jgi:hypothetical protein
MGWVKSGDIVSIEGPVELVNGQLMLRIPLKVGGDRLAPLAKGVGQVEDGYLCVVLEPWLAEKLRVGEGSIVIVDNVNGKFTITRSEINDEIN